MFFIKKRKKSPTESQAGDLIDRTIHVPDYAPHQNLEPVKYKDPVAMKVLKENFSDKITTFLDKATPDRYNATFVDNIINRAKEQAQIDLDEQRVEHIRTIERSIASLWKGDLHYYNRLLADYEDEFQRRDLELRKLKAIYHKGTALEEYHEEV